jgi:hypothetical protein
MHDFEANKVYFQSVIVSILTMWDITPVIEFKGFNIWVMAQKILLFGPSIMIHYLFFIFSYIIIRSRKWNMFIQTKIIKLINRLWILFYLTNIFTLSSWKFSIPSVKKQMPICAKYFLHTKNNILAKSIQWTKNSLFIKGEL